MCCSLPRGSTSMLLGFTNFKAHVYLATSSVTQIKPPDDSSNTNNPPPLPAVRTHLVHICTHAYIHIHRHIHAPHLRVSHQVHTSMLQKWDSTFFFIMKLLLFLWELSKKIKVSCKWRMMYGTNTEPVQRLSKACDRFLENLTEMNSLMSMF